LEQFFGTGKVYSQILPKLPLDRNRRKMTRISGWVSLK